MAFPTAKTTGIKHYFIEDGRADVATPIPVIIAYLRNLAEQNGKVKT